MTAMPVARHPAVYPIKVAGVDIGSNAIRLMVAEFVDFANYCVLETKRFPVRLGHDVFLTGKLTPTAMNDAISALAICRQVAQDAGVAFSGVVATSAVREAANGQAFVDRVQETLGWTVEVISGAEEARLLHLAVKCRMALGVQRWMTVDVGGGSVEVSLVDGSDILWSESHTMGAVRLLEELAGAGQEPGRFKRLLTEYIATLSLPSAADRYRPAGFIATGGNIEALLKLSGGKLDKNGVGVMSVSSLRNVIEQLARLSYRQRVEELGLREDRADVILPAALVYEKLAMEARAEEILVPFVGVRDGLVIDLLQSHLNPERSTRAREEQLTSGCLALGRRYLFDEQHAVQVMTLALALFDQLSPLHALTEEDRQVLTAAALLHDVGSFISRKRHHRHSQYVIAASDIPGLSASSTALAGVIARFHRKSEPTLNHPDLVPWSQSERLRVIMLSAFLRLADAMDREHLQTVSSLEVTIEPDALRLRVEARGDLLLEKWAMGKKAQLLSKLFSRKLLLQGEGTLDEITVSPRSGHVTSRRRA